jgi:hypothetical protein
MSGATSPAPFRIAFDNARDPYTARNALGILDISGGGGAPTDAEYITAAPDPTLTNERVLTDTASITWDFTTPGQAKANTASGGGNVSNSGTPTSGQYAKWVTATTIAGVAPAMVLSDIGGAPLASPTFTGDPKAPTPTAGDNDTSIATTAFVTAADNAVKTQLIGSASSGFDTLGEIENYIAANITPVLGNKADIFSPTLTGDPKAPTPATADNDTSIATTAYVQAQGYLTAATATATYQPLDADLTAIAALTGTNTIYYRSASNVWSPVVVSTGLSFSGGNLTSTVTSGAPVGAEYITSTADATLTSERVLTDTATVTWDRTTAGQIKANAAGGGTATPVPPQGRLTLQTLTPVMTTTQSAKTTIYYTPYVGNQIVLYNGTSMVPTTFAELSVATTDTTKSPAAIGVSKVNDWFVWNDAGTIRLGHGPDWTSDAARSAGTALVMVNGIYLNNASITNGPAAQRGTYVGTTRSNASSQLDWIIGGLAAGGSPSWFGVWNTYNRRTVTAVVSDTTDSWTYAGTTWRAANNSLNMRHSFVVGLAEDAWNARHHGMATATAGSVAGLLGVAADNAVTMQGISAYAAATGTMSLVAEISSLAPIGFHFAQAVEIAQVGTMTFYGDLGNAGIWQTGFVFNFSM